MRQQAATTAKESMEKVRHVGALGCRCCQEILQCYAAVLELEDVAGRVTPSEAILPFLPAHTTCRLQWDTRERLVAAISCYATGCHLPGKFD